VSRAGRSFVDFGKDEEFFTLRLIIATEDRSWPIWDRSSIERIRSTAVVRSVLLDHVCCTHEHRRGNLVSESFRGFHVDDQLERRRLLDGKIAGFRAFENSVDVKRGAAVAQPEVQATA